MAERAELSRAGNDKKLRGFSSSRDRRNEHSLDKMYGDCYSEYTLTKEDRILVVGSDGLWELLSNQNVIDVISPCY